jgi:hypothetical protein
VKSYRADRKIIAEGAVNRESLHTLRK